jgi:hypothetical protein
VITRTADRSPLVYARLVGWLYLVIIACGLFSELFVRSSLVVPGDSAATAGNIMASEGLFRIGFAADSIMLLSDVALAVLLYVLLKPVSPTLSLMAAAFRLTQAAVLGVNLLNQYTALLVLNGSEYGVAFEADQLNALAMLFLDVQSHGYDLGLLFFGLSTLILGYLVVRSAFLPRLLGFGLAAAGVVYLGGSYVRFLAPDYVSLVSPAYIIPILAEVSFCVWLLWKGAKVQP